METNRLHIDNKCGANTVSVVVLCNASLLFTTRLQHAFIITANIKSTFTLVRQRLLVLSLIVDTNRIKKEN